VCNLLIMKVVTIEQVERAAAGHVPARTNGHAKPEPPAPLEPTPAPEQSAPACTEATTLVDPGPTTVVEQVCALTARTCHWPLGNPRHPSFCFCNAPVVTAPYCEAHRTLAYSAPRTGSGHGVRVRLGPASAHDGPATSGVFSATPIPRAAAPDSAQPPLNREASPC
jgi:hypothetical protein